MAPTSRAPRVDADTERLRASPYIVCYWREGRLLLHHIPTARVVPADPIVVRVLHFFRDWRPASDLVSQWAPPDRRALRVALRRLLAGSFLHRQGASEPAEESLDAWGGWNPIASLFHFTTRRTRWLQGRARDDLEAEFQAKASAGPPPPPPVKRHPSAPRVALPRVPVVGEFADVLRRRRTWRVFGSRSIPLVTFAQLLDLTWGVQFWGAAGANDPVAFKTSPSGGARHPVEAYVVALKVEGLAPGLYHYLADTRELETLREGATARDVERYLVGQWYYREAAAVVIMSAVVAREQWRYPNPRAYRTLFLDAGHLCQTFCLVATWLGLGPFCTAALADDLIERDLGIDGVNEIVLYAAGVGSRPADGRWVQWPAHKRGHPYLPQRRRPRSNRRRIPP